MLFLPGLGCPGEVWDETVKGFQNQYQCHVFTLAGFASQPALKGATLATIKDQVIAYIESKKLKNVSLIGHSLGGFMSFWIASERPKLIKKVVAVDGLPFLGAMQNPYATSESMRPMAQKMKDNMLKSRSTEVATKMQMRTLRTMITDKKHIDQVLQWNLKSDQAAVAQAMYDMYTVDLREKVANIKAPTLVMGVWWGKDFGSSLEAVRQTYMGQIKKIPNHQFLMHEKAKHFIMYDDPTWFQTQLKKFLNK
ncbi:hypothetical protein BKI52_31580 [marine bacterium AO1-C]|nr:hypothetical protein BKI52_31580 [marine bacterium AO1-C]